MSALEKTLHFDSESVSTKPDVLFNHVTRGIKGWGFFLQQELLIATMIREDWLFCVKRLWKLHTPHSEFTITWNHQAQLLYH